MAACRHIDTHPKGPNDGHGGPNRLHWTGASGKQRTQSRTSGTEARDWNIRGRYRLECSGQHQGEEAAAARRKGEESTNKSKMPRRATAEAGTGLRQREGMEEGGRGEGQRQDAEGETQGTEQEGGEKKKGEAVGKGVS